MGKSFRTYIFHPLSIGFLLSILLVFVFARFFPKYNSVLIEESELHNNGEIYYYDLDNDGLSEKLNYYHYDKIFQPTLYLYTANNDFKSLWSFLESPIENNIFVGDYNNDNIKEIFVFTQKEDSLFLYILNPNDEKNLILKRRFISQYKATNEDIQIEPLGLFNFNENRKKEFLFAVDAGYPSEPRKIFSLDIDNNILDSSEELNADIIYPIIVEDINSDGNMEILISNKSINVIGNGSESQFIILNNKLEFFIQPAVFIGESSQITIKPIYSNNKKTIAVLRSGTNSENVFNNLIIYDLNGEVVIEYEIENKSNLSILNINDNQNNLYLFSGRKIYKYSDELKKIKTISISRNEDVEFVKQLSLTGSKTEECIFRNKNQIIVFSDNLRYKSVFDIAKIGKLILTVENTIQEGNNISIQTGDKWYLYNYCKKNDFFFSRMFYFLIIVFIILLSTFIPWIIIKIKNLRVVIKRNNEDEFYAIIESNIEEKFTGLKSKVNKIGSNIKNESFHKILNEIDETFKEIKTLPKKIVENSKEQRSFQDRIKDLVNKNDDNIDITIKWSIEDHLQDIVIEIENFIIDYLKLCFKIISQNSRNCKIVLQLIKHNNFVNLLMEIDDYNIDFNSIKENSEIKSFMKRIKGEIDINDIEEVGLIINTSIPLNIHGLEDLEKEKKIRIVIAEDHDVSLFGLTSMFKTIKEIEVVGTAKNGMEVLKILKTQIVDIVITDISMPGMDGIELSAKLKTEYPQIKVIVFTMYMENWFVEQLTNNGAKGFVSKNSKIIELVGAVKSVYEGNNYYCPQFKSKFGFNNGNSDGLKQLDSLTKTEMQIMAHFAENRNKEQMAEKMNLNIKIIDVFVANMLLKLNAGNEEEIILIAKKQKFIS